MDTFSISPSRSRHFLSSFCDGEVHGLITWQCLASVATSLDYCAELLLATREMPGEAQSAELAHIHTRSARNWPWPMGDGSLPPCCIWWTPSKNTLEVLRCPLQPSAAHSNSLSSILLLFSVLLPKPLILFHEVTSQNKLQVLSLRSVFWVSRIKVIILTWPVN